MNPLDSGISGSGIVTFAMNVGGNPGLPDAINDIEWARLGLTEDAPQVFAEHPNEEQLHATETQHGDDQRRVPAHRLAPDEGLHHDPAAHDKRRGCKREPNVHGDLQGRDGKGGNPFQGEVPQLPVVELGGAGNPRITPILDGNRREPDPGEQPLHEPVMLAQAHQLLDYPAGHQPTVAGIGRDGHPGQPADDPVERCSRGLLPE